MTRRGVTLLEALVALVLAAWLVSMALLLLASQARVGGRLTRRLADGALARGAAQVVATELGGASRDGDLAALTGSAVELRALRLAGTLCAVLPDGVVIDTVVARRRLRAPDPLRDQLLVALRDSAAWRTVAFTAVGTGACIPEAPYLGRRGLRLTLAAGSTTGVEVGWPARVVEPVRIALGQSGGLPTLLHRSLAGGTNEPVAGPLVEGGFSLSLPGQSGSPDLLQVLAGGLVAVRLAAPADSVFLHAPLADRP